MGWTILAPRLCTRVTSRVRRFLFFFPLVRVPNGLRLSTPVTFHYLIAIWRLQKAKGGHRLPLEISANSPSRLQLHNRLILDTPDIVHKTVQPIHHVTLTISILLRVSGSRCQLPLLDSPSPSMLR